MANKKIAIKDPWHHLKQFTSARIGLGRAGGSIQTNDWLDFKLAHARARDAVHCEFDTKLLIKQLRDLGKETLLLSSKIENRTEYLKRPDLGRRLDGVSEHLLGMSEEEPSDLVIIVSDGLSATAVHAHVASLLNILIPKLLAADWTLSSIVIVRYGRVAIEDEIGAALGVDVALMLIGERPGLTAPDSLGAYLVHAPNVNNTDANRNCVSNIRPAGLSYQKAADIIYYLLNEMRQRRLSGIELKDER
ncbi:MAG: ethanolamine ammonia-lyase [Piscirickettsiaceae bacterium]|nr:MAG: ethanolamine ammonia-lyase [Piscirickettsiaceae bacterium]PCI66465.1 MAG: ethanolamine ammonia-lyase [Piscirickettsiaceae bacterium]